MESGEGGGGRKKKGNLNFNRGKKAVRKKGLLKRFHDVHESFSRSSGEIRRESSSWRLQGVDNKMSSFQLWYLVGGGYLEVVFKTVLLEGMKGRFDWNWRIARGLLISTRWILMKKRLETDGESSSWNIVLHLPSLSSISFSLSLSRARALPRIFFSPSFSRPDPFFIRRPRWNSTF